MSIRNVYWPEDQNVLFEFFRQVYGPEDCELLTAWYGRLPTFDPADCFVIEGEQEGEIAAHARLVSRQLQIGEALLPTAEIAALSVLEPYLGYGYERDLLDALHARMDERGDALALGFGDPYLYEAWQYEYAVGLYLTSYESEIMTDLVLKAGHWNTDHSYERRTADRLGAHNRTINVRRFYINDLPAVQELYENASAAGHYMIARDADTWNWQLDHMLRIGRNNPDDFLVAEIDNRLMAYVRVVTQEPVNWFCDSTAARFSVIEAAGVHPDAVEALLAAIAHTAQTLGVERIGLFVHPDSAFMRHTLARGAAVRAFTGAGFIRLHNLPQVLHDLTPELEERRLRSPYAGRGYHLVVRTEHEQAEIYLGMGEAEVIELEVPSTSLSRLVTGWYGIGHLTTGYSERHADVLHVLFPQRDPKIGLADML